MDFINFKSLNLTAEESEDLIKLLAQKRGITTKELLSTIKLNLKRKNKIILDYEPVLIKPGFDNNYLEYMNNGNNSLSLNEYLELIKPYLYDLINVHKTKGEWKIQLSAEISFISQKTNSNEIRVMFTRSIPEEFMIGSETEEVAERLFMSILQKYQDNLQNKMKGSDFIFNGINYLYYDLNRITISRVDLI